MPNGDPPFVPAQMTKETPLLSPRERREKPIPEGIWRVVELVIGGQLAEAEIRLREELAAVEFHALHAQGRAIARVEQLFGQIAKRNPWPEDFRPAELIHWRGKIGAILSGVPLARLIDDLKATAGGKRNLLYYLSAEQGKRASRWEMLLCDVREEEWQAEKQREAEDAKRFFESGDVDPPRAVEPDWVRRLKSERTMLERETQGQPGPASSRRKEIGERLRHIAAILEHRGYETKAEG